MTLLAISAIGADRRGIVAAVTQVLYEHGCNLEDTSMTILRGHFAMTLVVAGDEPAETLDAALQPVARDLDLLLTVREVAPEAAHPSGRPYVVTVYGADHPGIVARVSGVLAGLGVNVTDLTTRLIEDGTVYAMVVDADLPAGLDPAAVSAALARAATDLDVSVTVRPADPDIL
jgi:glycine cleavage system transcriptional repressor